MVNSKPNFIEISRWGLSWVAAWLELSQSSRAARLRPSQLSTTPLPTKLGEVEESRSGESEGGGRSLVSSVVGGWRMPPLPNVAKGSVRPLPQQSWWRGKETLLRRLFPTTQNFVGRVFAPVLTLVTTANAVRLMCLFLALLRCADSRADTTAPTNTIGGLVVVLVDEASIAATIEGSVSEVVIGEGDTIAAGDVIIQLDDRKARLDQSLAQRATEIANHRQTETSEVDAAEVAVSVQEQLISEHEIRSELNRRRAANELKINAAEKAQLVAKNEWQRAQAARQNFADAVSDSEIDGLHLAYQRSQLETREATFQLEMVAIDVRLDRAMGKTLQWQLESARVALQAARSTDQVRKLEAEIQNLKLELARVASEEHHIQSPIDGTVVSISARVGDWVRSGQVVARIIDRKRLRAEGYVTTEHADALRNADDVRVVITSSDGTMIYRHSVKEYVSPEMDAVTGEVRVWIEFENSDGGVYPGSKATVEVR